MLSLFLTSARCCSTSVSSLALFAGFPANHQSVALALITTSFLFAIRQVLGIVLARRGCHFHSDASVAGFLANPHIFWVCIALAPSADLFAIRLVLGIVQAGRFWNGLASVTLDRDTRIAFVDAIDLFVIGGMSVGNIANDICVFLILHFHGDLTGGLAEGGLVVVHNALVIVRATEVVEINWVGYLEVVRQVSFDSVLVDSHSFIAIGTIVLMVQADGVHELVHDGALTQTRLDASCSLAVAQAEVLCAITIAADSTVAYSVCGNNSDVIFFAGSWNKFNARLGFDRSHGCGNIACQFPIVSAEGVRYHSFFPSLRFAENGVAVIVLYDVTLTRLTQVDWLDFDTSCVVVYFSDEIGVRRCRSNDDESTNR